MIDLKKNSQYLIITISSGIATLTFGLNQIEKTIAAKGGVKVEIEYVRNKKKSKKKVTLGEREDFESDEFRLFRSRRNG